jgi:hypothetical protein
MHAYTRQIRQRRNINAQAQTQADDDIPMHSHCHLRLQLPQLLLFVVLLDSRGRLACGIRDGCQWQLADCVAHGDGAGVEHLVRELFLLELGQLLVELVFVDGVVRDARGDGFGDLFADRMLFAEALPVGMCQ